MRFYFSPLSITFVIKNGGTSVCRAETLIKSEFPLKSSEETK